MEGYARILSGRIEGSFLGVAAEWLQALIVEFGIGADDAYRLELCAEELVTNTLNYADTARQGEPFEICAGIGPHSIALEFIDGAQPYDPLAAHRPRPVPGSIDEFTIGGNGITLVKEYADACEYRYHEGCNRLSLNFRLAQPAQRRAPAELARVDIFRGVALEALEDILARLPIRQFAAETVLLTPGQINLNVLAVLAGTIMIRIGTGDNSEMFEIGAGGCAGEMSVIDGSPVSAQVIAAAGTRLLLIDKASFIERLLVLPAVSRNLMHALSERMRRSNELSVKRIRIEAEMAQVHRELAMAREIQESLLPKEPLFPAEPRVACTGRMRTAREVGGDFYDAFFLDADHLFFVVGDVCGKGLPASLFMVRAISALRAQAGSDYLDPDYIPQVIGRLNRQLCAYNDKQQFLTAFCGILNIASGELRFVNAGHNPPLVGDAAGRFAYLEEPINPIVGMIGDLAYRPGAAALPPGATLLLFTDGVTEAESADGGMYGEAQLLELANSDPGDGVRGLVGRVFDSVGRFAGDAAQSDDITVLAIARR